MRDKLLELCYIGQHFLQPVSSTTDHVQKGILLGDIKRCYDTKQQIQKFVAALRDALPQVELISTSRNRGGNKNVAQNVCRRVLYTGQVSCNLCPNKIARQVAGKIG